MCRQNTHRRPTRKRYDEEAVPYNEDNRPYILHHTRSGFSGLAFPCNSVFRVIVKREVIGDFCDVRAFEIIQRDLALVAQNIFR